MLASVCMHVRECVCVCVGYRGDREKNISEQHLHVCV